MRPSDAAASFVMRVFALAAALACAGPALAQPPAPGPPPGSSVIRGRITAADTGRRTANPRREGRYDFRDRPAGR